MHAVDRVSLELAVGSFTAVMGPSGSGKSTLLHCAAGLDKPTSGTVQLAGIDLGGMSQAALTRLRRTHVGFVFQSFNLLPSLTAAENIMLPLRLGHRRLDKARLTEILQRVGLYERRDNRPAQLSGGQQQRVAVARALVTEPAVVFADEPTGALDTGTAVQILTLLRTAALERQQTIMMVTHDPVAASFADRVVFLADGEFVAHLDAPTPAKVAEQMTRLGAWAAMSAGRGGR